MLHQFHIIIAVVNDLMQRGLVHTIAKENSLKLLATAANARELFQAVKDKMPDMAIIDTSLTLTNSIDVMQALQEMSPLTTIIAISDWHEKGLTLKARDAGAMGLVSKDAPGEEILQAIQQTLRGKEHCCSISAQKLEEDGKAAIRQKGKIKLKKLTEKEIQVICLSSLGHTNADIAEKMGLKKRTIDDIKIHIGLKINKKTTSEMVNYAREHKLIP